METVYIESIPEQNLEVGLYRREVIPITVTERHTPSALGMARASDKENTKTVSHIWVLEERMKSEEKRQHFCSPFSLLESKLC